MKQYLSTAEAGKATVGGYTTFTKAAIVSTEGLGIAAKAASIGMKVLQAAINFGIMLAISLAIQAIVSVVSNLINAQQEAIDKAKELTSTYNDSVNTIKSNTSTLEGLKDEYAILSKGVDEYGNNISLTTEQYKRYKEIVEQVVGISPNVVKGYNTEGEAIVNNNTLIQEAINLQKQLNDEKKATYLTQGTDILAGAKGEKNQAETDIAKIKNQINDLFNSAGMLSEEWGKQQGNFWDELIKSQNGQQINSVIEKYKNTVSLSDEEVQSLKEQVNLIDLKNQAIDASIKKISTYLSIWASSDQNSDWYAKIPTGYLDEFQKAVDDVSKDTDLSIEQMEIKVMNLGQDFNKIKDQVPTKEISDLQDKLKAGTISQDDYNKQIDEYVKQIHNLADSYKNTNPLLYEFINLIVRGFNDLKDTNSSDGNPAVVKTLDDITKSTKDVVSSTNTLNSALQEQKKNGKLSADTVLSLIDAGYASAIAFDAETGAATLNRDAMLDLAKSKIAVQIADLKVLQSNLMSKLNGEYGAAGMTAQAFMQLAAAKALAGDADAMSFESVTAQIKNLETLTNGLGKFSGGKSGGGSSKSDKTIKAFDTAKNALDHQLAMGLISEEEYYKQLELLNDKYYKNKKKYQDEYQKNEESIYKFEKQHAIDLIDQQIKINETLRDSTDTGSADWNSYNNNIIDLQRQKETAIVEQINHLLANGFDTASEEVQKLYQEWYGVEQNIRDEQKKTLEAQKDNYDKAIGAVKNLLDKQIDALQKQKDALSDESIQGSYGQRIKAIQDTIDALQKQNDEATLANKIEEDRQKLADASRQKTKYIFENGKFTYEADTTAIADAQKNLNDDLLQQQIADLQTQEDVLKAELQVAQDAIDAQITALKDYETQWTEITDNYQNSQDALMAAELLGTQWEADILNQRLTTLKSFADQYLAIQEAITGITATPIPEITTVGNVAVPSYATGRSGGSGGLSITDENGMEIKIHQPTSGMFTLLGQGDSVIPADRTKNLWNWGAFDPKSFASQLSGFNGISSGYVGKQIGNGDINSINVDKLVFPNVTDGEGIKQAIYELPNYFKQKAHSNIK